MVKGRGGKLVELPKGTLINTQIWLMHMNPKLWGPTVEDFNPDREFLPEEVWHGKALAAYNPSSHRYMYVWEDTFLHHVVFPTHFFFLLRKQPRNKSKQAF